MVTIGHIAGIVLVVLLEALSASAGEVVSNVTIRLPIADVADRIFVRPNVGHEPFGGSWRRTPAPK